MNICTVIYIIFIVFMFAEIRSILDDQALYEKYEDFMVRRVLAVDPDTRWCPAPDCRSVLINIYSVNW